MTATYCESCGAANEQSSRFCLACGQPLVSTGVRCPTCGGMNSADDQFCENCGARLVAPLVLAPSARPAAPIASVVVLIVALLVAGSVGIWWFSTHRSTAAATKSAQSSTSPNQTQQTQTPNTAQGQSQAQAQPGVPTPLSDLSGLANVTASSTNPKGDYSTLYLTDNNPSTCWEEGVAGYGAGTEWVEFDFRSPVTVGEIRIIPGYDKIVGPWDRWYTNGRVKTAQFQFSDGTSQTKTFNDDRSYQTVTVDPPRTTTSVRMTIEDVYGAQPGIQHYAEDTSVSELHVWGTQ